MKLRIIVEAEKELDDAVAYYNLQRPGLGTEFAGEAAGALNRIKDYPLAWKRIGPRVRSCGMRRFPYGIVYMPLQSEIVVLAIMHLRRKPEYWIERMKRD